MKKVQNLYSNNNYAKVKTDDGKTNLCFRSSNGNVALFDPDRVIMKLRNKDKVNVITLKAEEREISFFEVNGKYRPIMKDYYLEDLPSDLEFTNTYIYEEDKGIYVVYIADGGHGILYIDSDEIKVVITHKFRYNYICFKEDLFYAYLETDKEGCFYHILSMSGDILYRSADEFKGAKGYSVYFNEDVIYVHCSRYYTGRSERVNVMEGHYIATSECYIHEIQAEEKIENAEVISIPIGIQSDIRVIKVKGTKTNYYYALNSCEKFTLLLATLKNDAVEVIDRNLIISEYKGKICISVSRLFGHDLSSYCNLKCKDEIKFIGRICSEFGCKSLYNVDDREIYMTATSSLTSRFEKVCDIEDIDDFKVCKPGSIFDDVYENYDLFIVGFVKGKPDILISYDYDNLGVQSVKIDEASEGYSKNTFICKAENTIFLMDNLDFLGFIVKGKKFYKKTLKNKNGRDNQVYMVENEDGIIRIFDSCDVDKTDKIM